MPPLSLLSASTAPAFACAAMPGSFLNGGDTFGLTGHGRSPSPVPGSSVGATQSDSLSRQVQALQQAKNMAAAQQVWHQQQMVQRQDYIRREALSALRGGRVAAVGPFDQQFSARWTSPVPNGGPSPRWVSPLPGVDAACIASSAALSQPVGMDSVVTLTCGSPLPAGYITVGQQRTGSPFVTTQMPLGSRQCSPERTAGYLVSSAILPIAMPTMSIVTTAQQVPVQQEVAFSSTSTPWLQPAATTALGAGGVVASLTSSLGAPAADPNSAASRHAAAERILQQQRDRAIAATGQLASEHGRYGAALGQAQAIVSEFPAVQTGGGSAGGFASGTAATATVNPARLGHTREVEQVQPTEDLCLEQVDESYQTNRHARTEAGAPSSTTQPAIPEPQKQPSYPVAAKVVAAPQTEVRATSPRRVERADPAEVKKAHDAVRHSAQAIKQNELRELKNYQKPPMVVKNVLDALAILLGVTDVSRYANIRKVLGANLAEKIKGFHHEEVTVTQYRKVRKLLALPEFNEETVRNTSPAAASVCIWIRAEANYLAKTRFPPASSAGSASAAAASADLATPREEEPEATNATAVNAVEEMVAPVAVETCMTPRPEVAAPGMCPTCGGAVSAMWCPSCDATVVAPPLAELAGLRQSTVGPSAPLASGLVINPDLSKLDANDRRQIGEFSVSKADVGSIVFHGITDTTGMDIERLVSLQVGEVLVYPEPKSKPPAGQGLNKRATVTMYECWPPSGKGSLDAVKDQEKYRKKIQQMTEKKKARFIDYDCQTGMWKFEVNHF